MPARKNIKYWIVCIGICSLLNFDRVTAQKNTDLESLIDFHRGANRNPFLEKDETVGSTYLSRKWLRGVAEMSNHKKLPEADQPLLFNFDKMNNVLYTVNRESKIKFLSFGFYIEFSSGG